MSGQAVGCSGLWKKQQGMYAPAVWALCRLLAVSGVFCATRAACGQASCYEIAQVIQGPTCQFTGPAGVFGLGISPNGRYVCGYYPVYSGEAEWRAFLFDTQTSQFTTLPLPPGIQTMRALDVNDTPWVVGRMEGSAEAFGFVFDFDSGAYIAQVSSPVNGGNGSGFSAINAHGVVCGTRTISLNPVKDNAFTWSLKDGVVDLGLVDGESTTASDINDNLG